MTEIQIYADADELAGAAAQIFRQCSADAITV